MRIIFMGTPEFAVPSLEQMHREGYTPVGVVTAPDKPRGRGQKVSVTPVKQTAQNLDIPIILQPEILKDPSFFNEIAGLQPDVIVVVAFRILPADVFTLATRGAFNLHGSLLPKYRGAAPIHRAILAGEVATGVTTFFLKEKVDTGDIILQKTMPIGPDDTAGDVHDRMKIIGADAVLESLRRIEAGPVTTLKQDDRLASPAPKIFRDECRIDWQQPAETVHNHIRGLAPFPGAWTYYGNILLKIFRSRVVEGRGAPGSLQVVNERLLIFCGLGAVEILELQQPGKQRLQTAAFVKGFQFETKKPLT